MRRMNGLDALLIHTDQINAFQHTLKIAILDPGTMSGGWNYDEFRDALRAMPKVLPFASWKYIKVPFGLHHPLWIEDPDFDIDYHIRHVACPAPGDNRALCDLIAQLYITPLDHARPLWMVWVIEGLQDGKIANVMLLHHAYADGVGASIMMHRCYKLKPFTFSLRYARPIPPPIPTKSRLLFDALCDLPVLIYHSLPKAIRGIVKMRQQAKSLSSGANKVLPLQDSPANAMLSACRSFAFQTFDLARIKRISKHYGVTINDLYVACVALAYRRLMIAKGYDPDAGPLKTAIPFSKRPRPGENEDSLNVLMSGGFSKEIVDDGIGNLTTTNFLGMPVHIADPLSRLTAARQSGLLMKEQYRKAEGADFNNILDLMPAFVIRAIGRMIARSNGKISLTGNAMLSNVAGPKRTLYFGKMKLDNWISTGHVMHGMAINTTAWSYVGKFNVSVLADKKVLLDAWSMIADFSAALNEYEEIARRKQTVNVTDIA